MAISQEWMKGVLNVREFFLALRTALGPSRFNIQTRKTGVGKTRVPTVLGANALELRMLAELERKKSLAYANNGRTMVR